MTTSDDLEWLFGGVRSRSRVNVSHFAFWIDVVGESNRSQERRIMLRLKRTIANSRRKHALRRVVMIRASKR